MSSSFEHAPVSKALLVLYSSCTLVVSLFDLNVYLNIPSQPVTRLSQQPWRLLTHTVYAPSTPTLLLLLVLLHSMAAPLERRMGAHKFLSLLTLVWMLGPLGVTSALAVIHTSLVPSVYHFRIFRVPLGEGWISKGVLLVLLFMLTNGASVWGGFGVLAGMIWTSDVGGVKGFRVRGGQRLGTWIGETFGKSGGGVRRTRSALPGSNSSVDQRAESQ